MEVPHELSVATDLAKRTAAAGGQEGKFARRMHELLMVAVKRIESFEVAEVVARPAQRAQGVVEYMVEGSGAAEVLAEHRLSGKSYPFRCPRSVYDAVVGVLASADRALSVEEIASGLERVLGDRPADFQVRVPLRFWMHMDVPPVVRLRARYRATNPTTFRVITGDLWERLRLASKNP